MTHRTDTRTVAGVGSDGEYIQVANANPSNYFNVRLTDGSAFYTATGSGGGGGSATTVNIGSYGGAATTLGQKAMAASIPVVFASDQSSITASINNQSVFVLNSAAPQASVNIATDSVGLAKDSTAQIIYSVLSDVTSTVGSAVPPKSIYIGFRDLSGNLNFARVFGNNTNIATTSGNILGASVFTYIKNGSIWEPVTGIGSNGMTVTGSNISIASMPTTNVSVTGQPVTVNANQSGAWFVTANVSNTINANVTAAQSIPSNFQNTTNVNSWGGTSTTLGQKAMTASVPVVLPNNQTVAVNVSNFSDNAFSNTSNIGSYGGTATTLGQKSMTASIPTVIASDQTALPVNASQNGSWYITANNSSIAVDTIVQTYSDNTSSSASSAMVCSGYRWATFAFQASMANAPTILQFNMSGTIDGTNYEVMRNGFLGSWIYDDVILGTGYTASVMFPINHHAIKVGVSTSGNNNSKTFTITRANMRFSY